MREYFLDLMGSIRAARAAGHGDNSPEMLTFVRAQLTPRYGAWKNFDDRVDSNVAGILRGWSAP